MRVLVGCEFSGQVRDAFRQRGHDAWSCDLLDTEGRFKENHLKTDVLSVLDQGWDLAIFHPPCTFLAVSGARWLINNPERQQKQQEALDFVRILLAAPIPHIALENPVSVISTHIRPPDQIIQPWQFGWAESKKTCLWLKNLPKLVSTHVLNCAEAVVHRMSPGPNRSHERSRTCPGIAAGMAIQWGALNL